MVDTDPVQARQAEERRTLLEEHQFSTQMHDGWFVATCECGKHLGAHREESGIDKAYEDHLEAVVDGEESDAVEDAWRDQWEADVTLREADFAWGRHRQHITDINNELFGDLP